MRSMEEKPQFRDQFTDLLLRDEDTLTDDERASVKYLLADFDVRTGLKPNTKARRWAVMAWKIGRYARKIGRLPTADDPDVTEDQLAWIEAQRGATLNSYQRACLNAMPGWT